MTTTIDPNPSAVSNDAQLAQAQAALVRSLFAGLRSRIGRVYVGQEPVVEFVLYTLLAGGHVLIEGVPGLGKTLLVRTLSAAVRLPMSRIQFTPDLMPADVTGTTVLTEAAGGGHELKFQPGPLVSSLVLADEINRATPKTQSALLEAMQEGQVSVAGRTIVLPEPFMVLATQNPVEQEGTYPLPEAQLDRFLVKVIVRYPSAEEMDGILVRTTGDAVETDEATFTGEDVLAVRKIVRQVPAAKQVRSYAIKLVLATQPDQPTAPDAVKKHVAFGAGPRAAQALLLLAKARAVVNGRFAVSCEDVREVAPAVLRHRLVLNFAGLAERVDPDAVVKTIIANTSELTTA
ncbi:MAG: MoxR family ATPase [Tepidisphaeraceae bacterium]